MKSSEAMILTLLNSFFRVLYAVAKTARMIASLDFVSAQFNIRSISGYDFIIDSFLTGTFKPTNDKIQASQRLFSYAPESRGHRCQETIY